MYLFQNVEVYFTKCICMENVYPYVPQQHRTVWIFFPNWKVMVIFWKKKTLTGSVPLLSDTPFPVSPPSLSPVQRFDIRASGSFCPPLFSCEDIFTHISLIFRYWMTVDSEIFMPKSKAPKMDDLDYSKCANWLAVCTGYRKLAAASCVCSRLIWMCHWPCR